MRRRVLRPQAVVVIAWFALALYTVGLLLALGWRSLAQWYRTGDTGLRLDAGPPGTLRWWAKLLFVAALLLGFAGPVSELAGLPTIDPLGHPGVRAAGVAASVAGVIATLAAQLAMGTSWRVGVDPAERTDLVTDGAFAVVRNPIFTAMAITSVGLTLMVPNAVSITATAVLIAAVQMQVRAVEEPYLSMVHGDRYTDYTRRVGRFLPRAGRASAASSTDHGGPTSPHTHNL